MSERKKRADRPHMPGYGLLSEEEGVGLLAWEWADRQLAEARNYWIASTRPDGRPHVAPVWGLWHQGKLYFGSGPQAVKTRNLADNPAVVIHLESGDEVVIVEGRVERVENVDLRRAIASDYAKKYGVDALGEENDAPLFAVTPLKVLAWREHDFPGSATRWFIDEE